MKMCRQNTALSVKHGLFPGLNDPWICLNDILFRIIIHRLLILVHTHNLEFYVDAIVLRAE